MENNPTNSQTKENLQLPSTNSTIKCEKELDWQQDHLTVASRNSFLLLNNLWSDIEFCFENENNIKIPAHRLILAASSNVLAAMAYGDFRTNCINIAEIPSQCMTEVLRYIYTDSVEITTENSACIMYAAHKYNLKLLETKCIQFIENDMKLENVCIYYDSLVINNDIIERCNNMIKSQTDKILQTDAFLELSIDKLTKLLQCDTLNATELQLYEGMLRWADNSCKLSGMPATAKNKRTCLLNAEKWIRFPAMSIDIFTECIQMDSEFLTKTEIGELSIGIVTLKNESQFCDEKRKNI